jgi:hypothetical protein
MGDIALDDRSDPFQVKSARAIGGDLPGNPAAVGGFANNCTGLYRPSQGAWVLAAGSIVIACKQLHGARFEMSKMRADIRRGAADSALVDLPCQ